jgi:hypothetical protein
VLCLWAIERVSANVSLRQSTIVPESRGLGGEGTGNNVCVAYGPTDASVGAAQRGGTLLISCGDGADARLIQYSLLHADGRFVPTATTSAQAKLHAMAEMFPALAALDSTPERGPQLLAAAAARRRRMTGSMSHSLWKRWPR